MKIALRLLFVLLVGSYPGGCASDTGVPGSPDSQDGTEVTDPDAAAADVSSDDLAPAEAVGPGPCEVGQTTCINGKLAQCDPAFGWLLENCPEGTSCDKGECIAAACEALAAQCADGGVQICSPDGKGWSTVMPCPEDTVCKEGVCVKVGCEPGERVCGEGSVLVCMEDGSGWSVEPCEEGEVCVEGQCIECVTDAECGEGEACEDGSCVVPELAIVTAALPDGKLGEPYSVTLEATGGVAPYAWSLVDSTLPAGLELVAAGKVAGTPTESGTFTVTVQVQDDGGASDQAEFSFEVFAAAAQLVITTGSPLPAGEEGTPYEAALAATGGNAPYFWGIASGALPAGLTLSSSGVVAGIPADHGDFAFTVKAFDNSEPVATGSKEFALTIKIAPLVIVGDQEYDLWVTKIIVLPLVTAVEGIPIPYSVQLQAKGGVKPYHWKEQPLPGFVSYLIPNGGIPKGLTLEDDGELHGAVTDPATAVSVKIPFTQIDLTGYFFMAEVSDSQEPPDNASAIYLAPTVPISW
jgi:hypothetical protein